MIVNSTQTSRMRGLQGQLSCLEAGGRRDHNIAQVGRLAGIVVRLSWRTAPRRSKMKNPRILCE